MGQVGALYGRLFFHFVSLSGESFRPNSLIYHIPLQFHCICLFTAHFVQIRKVDICTTANHDVVSFSSIIFGVASEFPFRSSVLHFRVLSIIRRPDRMCLTMFRLIWMIFTM